MKFCLFSLQPHIYFTYINLIKTKFGKKLEKMLKKFIWKSHVLPVFSITSLNFVWINLTYIRKNWKDLVKVRLEKVKSPVSSSTSFFSIFFLQYNYSRAFQRCSQIWVRSKIEGATAIIASWDQNAKNITKCCKKMRTTKCPNPGFLRAREKCRLGKIC